MRRLEQTLCPLGQGRERRPGPTNILPRWGREEEGRRALQTFCPAGAGKRKVAGPYKHSAPLGQGRGRRPGPTNILPRFVARFSKMDQEVSTVLSQARRVCWPGDIQPIRTRRRIGLRARQSESEGID